MGDGLFILGFVFEAAGMFRGVHSLVVGWSLVAYGLVLVWRGYLP